MIAPWNGAPDQCHECECADDCTIEEPHYCADCARLVLDTRIP